MSSEDHCSICDAGVEEFDPYADVQKWTYVRCRSCGVVSLHPIPNSNSLLSYYNQNYMVPKDAYARGAARYAPSILEDMRKRFPRRGKLLEIGASYGFFLDIARRDGWGVSGVELDDNAAKYGRDILKIPIFSGTVENAFPSLAPPYDVIVIFHVIEHVPDPIPFLELCRRVLAPNGVLILRTPNIESWIASVTRSYWQWQCPPAHIHLFSPKALDVALERSGFRVERLWSWQGDAHNNLFELACASARFLSRAKEIPAISSSRQSWASQWQVRMGSGLSEIIYYPFHVFLDPHLESKRLQPELVVIARN
jgi:SAM-dependent methyltransferase